MFSGIYKSYLSPIYWLIRMFGKDMKWKDRSDIDDDMFRICLKPRPSADSKAVNKAVQAVYGRILGIDPDSVSAAVSDYLKLFKEWQDIKADPSSNWNERHLFDMKLNELIFDNFAVAVKEDEREEIVEYCKKNKALIIVQDEWKDLQEMADWEAREEMQRRNIHRFKEQTIGALVASQLSGNDGDNDEDDDEYDRVENF